jgi:hypothetical protein
MRSTYHYTCYLEIDADDEADAATKLDLIEGFGMPDGCQMSSTLMEVIRFAAASPTTEKQE